LKNKTSFNLVGKIAGDGGATQVKAYRNGECESWGCDLIWPIIATTTTFLRKRKKKSAYQKRKGIGL